MTISHVEHHVLDTVATECADAEMYSLLQIKREMEKCRAGDEIVKKACSAAMKNVSHADRLKMSSYRHCGLVALNIIERRDFRRVTWVEGLL